MTSQPTVLSPATPSELLSYILSSQRYPTNLIIGSSKQDFLAALVEQLPLDETEPPQPPTETPTPTPTPSHPLLIPSLYQTAISRHIRIVFIPTVTHLRAYLSVFSATTSQVPPPPPPPPPHHNKPSPPPGKPPLLLVYGLLALHRDASEWSAQGIGNSVAVLVDCAARNGFRPVVVEPRGVGGHQDVQHLAGELVPLLNGTSRKSDGAFNGRSVSVRQVLGRWFGFEAREWESK